MYRAPLITVVSFHVYNPLYKERAWSVEGIQRQSFQHSFPDSLLLDGEGWEEGDLLVD
jgi:hypothetical protein